MKHLAYLLAMPILLSTDWKIVTRTGDSTLTEYFKGSSKRADSSPTYTTGMNFDHRRRVNWRSDLRQIVEWPPDIQPNSPSPVIHVERSTTDPGERKQLLGRTAHHLVSRITRSDGPETGDRWLVRRRSWTPEAKDCSIAATAHGHKITLFFSGDKHAGENLADVLRKRCCRVTPPIQMCDASNMYYLAMCEAGGRNYVCILTFMRLGARYISKNLARRSEKGGW